MTTPKRISLQSPEIAEQPRLSTSGENIPTSLHDIPSSTSRGHGTGHHLQFVPGMPSRKKSDDSDDGNHAANHTYLPLPEQGNIHRAAGLSIGNEDKIHDDEALKPDPSTQTDYEMEDNKFGFSPRHMSSCDNGCVRLKRVFNPVPIESVYMTCDDTGVRISVVLPPIKGYPSNCTSKVVLKFPACETHK